MTRNNYTFGHILGASIFGVFVGILSVMATLTVKPHATAQASVTNHRAEVATLATIAQPHAVVIFDAPEVESVEVLPEATTEAATPHHQTTQATAHSANPSEGESLTPEEIERVKAYIMAHRVHVDIVEIAGSDPAPILAAK